MSTVRLIGGPHDGWQGEAFATPILMTPEGSYVAETGQRGEPLRYRFYGLRDPHSPEDAEPDGQWETNS